MEINPHIAAGIRKGINDLYDMGADHFGDYWLDELHEIDGYPIEHRWHAYNLHLIQKDVAQIAAETGQLTP